MGRKHQYPVKLPYVTPTATDRLREAINPILDDMAYYLALFLGRDGVTPALRGSVTLAVAPATTTTISNDLVTTDSLLVLTANNAAAAADVGSATGIYVTYAAGVITINHPASAGSRTFQYVIFP